MQYSFVKACLLALAATTSVLAQTAGFNVISAPAAGDVLVPGTTYTIKWTPSEPAGPVTLILLQGLTNTTLQIGNTIAAGISSSVGKYDWAVPADAGSFAAYGIKLQLDSAPATFQYSHPFTIRAGSVTKTVQISQISTLAPTSTSSTLSSSSTISSTSTSTSAPLTTSTSTSSSAPVTTSTSASVSSSSVTFQNSTTLLSTTIAAPTVVTPSASASSTPAVVKASGAGSNVIQGAGLLGALVFSFVMLL